jgi:hypothetical protein
MKKMVTFLLVITMLVVFTACNEDEKVPEELVNDFEVLSNKIQSEHAKLAEATEDVRTSVGDDIYKDFLEDEGFYENLVEAVDNADDTLHEVSPVIVMADGEKNIRKQIEDMKDQHDQLAGAKVFVDSAYADIRKAINRALIDTANERLVTEPSQ